MVIEASGIQPDAAAGTMRTPEKNHKWGPILVGTDGSEGAGRAIDAAGRLAADLGTDLWIVHVVDGTSDTGVTRFAR